MKNRSMVAIKQLYDLGPELSLQSKNKIKNMLNHIST